MIPTWVSTCNKRFRTIVWKGGEHLMTHRIYLRAEGCTVLDCLCDHMISTPAGSEGITVLTMGQFKCFVLWLLIQHIVRVSVALHKLWSPPSHMPTQCLYVWFQCVGYAFYDHLCLCLCLSSLSFVTHLKWTQALSLLTEFKFLWLSGFLFSYLSHCCFYNSNVLSSHLLCVHLSFPGLFGVFHVFFCMFCDICLGCSLLTHIQVVP